VSASLNVCRMTSSSSSIFKTGCNRCRIRL
jgi:hypothetical protein